MQALLSIFRRIAAFFTGLAAMIASFFGGGGAQPFAPVLENRYAGTGVYEAVQATFPAEDAAVGAYTVWYPAGAENCPAVLFLNGTGQKTSCFQDYFSRIASFGIVAIGTEDTAPGHGDSAQMALAFLLTQNADPDSVLFGKVNTDKIGIAGYSQGGAGALRSASLLPFAEAFCTVAVISPSNETRAHSMGWDYDPSRISVPVFILSGTADDDAAGTVTSLSQLQETFIKLAGPKAMARKTGAGHQNARQETVGYVAAWLCWQLCEDTEAAKVFTGGAPEIAANPDWQDVCLQF